MGGSEFNLFSAIKWYIQGADIKELLFLAIYLLNLQFRKYCLANHKISPSHSRDAVVWFSKANKKPQIL